MRYEILVVTESGYLSWITELRKIEDAQRIAVRLRLNGLPVRIWDTKRNCFVEG